MSRVSTYFDSKLLIATLSLLLIGLIMVCSASITIAENKTGQPLYFFIRQLAFAGLGLFFAWCVMSIRLSHWQQMAPMMLMVGVG